MACLPNLIIAGVVIPHQSFPTQQSYSILGGEFSRRKLNGAAVKQSHWRKLATRIDGDGGLPPALAGVDFTAAVQIACIEPRSRHSATNSLLLPSDRRTDADVHAFALVGNRAVATPCTVTVNTATATAVSGATAYQFLYYPLLTCFSGGPTESLDVSGAVYQWSLDAEEV